MQWYIQNVLCISCHTPCKLRQFQFCGNGQIKLIGWCEMCGRESTFSTELDTLILWAKHKDNPLPSDKDKEFLHDLRITWEEQKQFPPWKDDATGRR